MSIIHLDQFGLSSGREEHVSLGETLNFHEPVRHIIYETALIHRSWNSCCQWRVSRTSVFRIFAWMGLLLGTLKLSNVTSSFSGAMCGPWGCTAPLEAVLACHLAWMIVLTPIVVWCVRNDVASHRQGIGMGLTVFALAVMLVLCGISLQESFAIPGATKYLPQRMALKIVGCVDLPVFASLLLGGWCLATTRRNSQDSHAGKVLRNLPFVSKEVR